MEDPRPQLPERIGPYRVLQLLGQGGMGAVYEAEESSPVRRRVAVKVIRPGLGSGDVIARFEGERQAVALMNHPGIARVLQAGTTPDGAPYFAMELVHGLSITTFCDTHRLSVASRVELFVAVCRAVQHAHQKGIVHRDLKPSNILVAMQDDVAQPKVIDFGVAKAIGVQLTENALVTLRGAALGTVAYMSPEQADASGEDIDTRSDIYSLGVILFELLTGELPAEPTPGGVHEFVARLAQRSTIPPTPSNRLSSHANSEAVAALRGTDARRLVRDLRGDLDWIVTKAMRPDRADRYDSANALADDLRRHLGSEPVVARPPTSGYRIAKFVQRHRTSVAAAVVAAFTLVAGTATSVVGFVHARRAERVAASEAAAARQVTSFMVDLFASADPGRRGDTVSARTLLALGAERARTDLSSQPLTKARFLQTLGTVNQRLGNYQAAENQFQEAAQITERELGPRDTALASPLRGLGDVARTRGAFDVADSAYRRALNIRVAALGPTHIDVATSIATIAALRLSQHRLSEAESLYNVVLPLDTQVRVAADPVRLRNLRGIASVYLRQGRTAEADGALRRVLALQESVLGRDHIDIVPSLINIGAAEYELGRFDTAATYYHRALSIAEPALAPNHETIYKLYNNLGEVAWRQKHYAEADSLLRRSLALKESVLKPGADELSSTFHALAGVLRAEGRYAESERFYRKALAIRDVPSPKVPADLAETLRDYADLLRRTARGAEAARMAARAAALAPPRPD